MSFSVSSDTTGVAAAVQHLQELGVRMKTDEFGFKEHDLDNIDKIIESILELEAERNKVHELLETETIKASVLRHKLLFLPTEVKEEITGAIESARNSDTSEISSLQARLDDIVKNTEALTERHAQLETENAVLHPKRDTVRQKHEEIIALLNQRMAEKASKQIVLNETRDKLRATNQHIVDLEEGIVQLKEDMIQERADARLEKKRLKKAVDETTKKVLDQKVVNVEKKKELDILHEKLLDSEADLDTIRKTIRRFDTSRAKLEGQERALDAQLKREFKHNQDLRKKGDALESEIATLTASYDQRKRELQERMEELDKLLKKGAEKNEVLEAERLTYEEQVRAAEEIMYADAEKVAEMTKILREAKDKQAKKAEDIARMNDQINEMNQQLESLAESHEAVVNQMNKQIEECRDQLSRERKDRMEVQQRKEEVERNVESFKTDNSKYMMEINRKITEGKKRHDELTKEGHALQKSIREAETRIRGLKVEYQETSNKLTADESKMLVELEELEKKISNLEIDLERKNETISSTTPGFENQERDYDERVKAYEEFKKEVVALKNRKTGLEDSVKRTQFEMEKVKRPQSELQTELSFQRDTSMAQLREQTTLVKNIEREIFEAGIKLKAAIDENNKFRQANHRFEREIIAMRADILFNNELHDKLKVNHGNLRGELTEGWQEDAKLEAEVSERDELYMLELAELLRRTMNREGKIDDVTNRLYEELSLLTDFLENVAQRRPVDSTCSLPSTLVVPSLSTVKPASSAICEEEPELLMVPPSLTAQSSTVRGNSIQQFIELHRFGKMRNKSAVISDVISRLEKPFQASPSRQDLIGKFVSDYPPFLRHDPISSTTIMPSVTAQTLENEPMQKNPTVKKKRRLPQVDVDSLSSSNSSVSYAPSDDDNKSNSYLSFLS